MEFGKRKYALQRKVMKLAAREGISLKAAWKRVQGKSTKRKSSNKMSPRKKRAVKQAKKAMKLMWKDNITLKQAWKKVKRGSRFGATGWNSKTAEDDAKRYGFTLADFVNVPGKVTKPNVRSLVIATGRLPISVIGSPGKWKGQGISELISQIPGRRTSGSRPGPTPLVGSVSPLPRWRLCPPEFERNVYGVDGRKHLCIPRCKGVKVRSPYTNMCVHPNTLRLQQQAAMGQLPRTQSGGPSVSRQSSSSSQGSSSQGCTASGGLPPGMTKRNAELILTTYANMNNINTVTQNGKRASLTELKKRITMKLGTGNAGWCSTLLKGPAVRGALQAAVAAGDRVSIPGINTSPLETGSLFRTPASPPVGSQAWYAGELDEEAPRPSARRGAGRVAAWAGDDLSHLPSVQRARAAAAASGGMTREQTRKLAQEQRRAEEAELMEFLRQSRPAREAKQRERKVAEDAKILAERLALSRQDPVRRQREETAAAEQEEAELEAAIALSLEQHSKSSKFGRMRFGNYSRQCPTCPLMKPNKFNFGKCSFGKCNYCK